MKSTIYVAGMLVAGCLALSPLNASAFTINDLSDEQRQQLIAQILERIQVLLSEKTGAQIESELTQPHLCETHSVWRLCYTHTDTINWVSYDGSTGEPTFVLVLSAGDDADIYIPNSATDDLERNQVGFQFSVSRDGEKVDVSDQSIWPKITFADNKSGVRTSLYEDEYFVIPAGTEAELIFSARIESQPAGTYILALSEIGYNTGPLPPMLTLHTDIASAAIELE